MSRFILDVGIKLSSHFGVHAEWCDVNETLHATVGLDSESAGTGFGVRDSQFVFETIDEAKRAEERVQKVFGDRVEYSCVYDEDDNGAEDFL